MLVALANRTDARGTPLFAWTRRDQFVRALEKKTRSTIERLAEADAAGIGVVKIKIRLEEFLRFGAIDSRLGDLLPFGIDSGIWRALANGGAKIAPVAHEEQSGDGFKGVEQAEHTALAVGNGEGKRRDEFAAKRDPKCGGVYFVFWQFKFAGADVFIREEFDFLEADDLRANKNVAVGVLGWAWRMDANPRFRGREPECSGSRQ